MKTIEQIARYASHCRFSDGDWEQVLAYCRERHKGGKVHRAKKGRELSDSTYAQFVEWVDGGFGTGDVVRYGHTVGIVSISTPSIARLAAYIDFGGELVRKPLDVMPQKMLPAHEEVSRGFMQKLFDEGYGFSQRLGIVSKLYRPEKFAYVTFTDEESGKECVGMYLESKDKLMSFAALLLGGRLKMGCEMPNMCTPLRPSCGKDIERLHRATSRAGWSFNRRLMKYVKQKGDDGRYFYLNDRFCVVQDKDNGESKHKERLDAGNYFIDLTEALTFAEAVSKLRKG